MKYEQKDSIEEQETFINIDYFEKKVVVYSNRATVMNKMVGAGYKPTTEFKDDSGAVCACEWSLPIEQLGKFVKMNLFGYRPSK